MDVTLTLSIHLDDLQSSHPPHGPSKNAFGGAERKQQNRLRCSPSLQASQLILIWWQLWEASPIHKNPTRQHTGPEGSSYKYPGTIHSRTRSGVLFLGPEWSELFWHEDRLTNRWMVIMLWSVVSVRGWVMDFELGLIASLIPEVISPDLGCNDWQRKLSCVMSSRC